jgi:hypothetical protein
LNNSNFKVLENGVEQTDYFDVEPPAQGGNSRLADIVFIVDNSGSFGSYQDAVHDNMVRFVDSLYNSDIDYALGLCRFGQYTNSGEPILEETGQLTTDADYFKNTVWSRNITDGGIEPAYDALTESATGFSFRPGVQKVFIILADEEPDQGTVTQQEAIQTLQNNSITLFSLTTSDSEPLNDVSSATNGRYYNITDPFNDILNDISATIGNSYLVKYRSLSDQFDGVKRNVKVEVSYNGQNAEDTTSYIPGASPMIQRTEETIEQVSNAWSEQSDLEIGVIVNDDIEPYTNEVTLYYKNSNSTSYQSIQMNNTLDSLWSASFPTSEVLHPGIDYYITATDGESTSSLPSVNPMTNPFQIAILPNEKPVINHSVINEFIVGEKIIFEAEITDNTNLLDSVAFYYRKKGDLSYTHHEMPLLSGDTYQIEITTTQEHVVGIEYYIAAWDDFEVRNSIGDVDNPIFISSMIGDPPEIEHASMDEYVVGDTILFEAIVTDEDGKLEEVKVFYKKYEESNYNELKLFNTSADDYSNYIISSPNAQDSIEYYITARDDNGNKVYYPGESETAVMWPVWDIGFRANMDGYRFNNNGDDMPDNNIEEGFLTWEMFSQAFGDEHSYLNPSLSIYRPTAIAYYKILSVIFDEWRGSCAGFAISSFMAYEDKTIFISEYPEYGEFDKLYDVSYSKEIANRINVLWLRQFGGEELLNYSIKLVLKTPNDVLDEMKQMSTQTDNFKPLYLHKTVDTAHTVNPISISYNRYDNDIMNLEIYDNNKGVYSKNIYIDFTKNRWTYPSNSNYSEWQSEGLFLNMPATHFYDYAKIPSKQTLKDSYLSAIFSNIEEVFTKSGDKISKLSYHDKKTDKNYPQLIYSPENVPYPIGVYMDSAHHEVKLKPDSKHVSIYVGNNSAYTADYYSSNYENDTIKLDFNKELSVYPKVSMKNLGLKTINVGDISNAKLIDAFAINTLESDSLSIGKIKRADYQEELMECDFKSPGSSNLEFYTLDVGLLIKSNPENKDLEYTLNYNHSSVYEVIKQKSNPIKLESNSSHLIISSSEEDNSQYLTFLLDDNNDGEFTDTLERFEVTGLKDIREDLNMEVFPNPSEGKYFLKTSSFDYRKPLLIKVYNSLYQKVISKTLNIGSSDVKTIDISNQPGGVYILEVSQGKTVITRKIIKY